MLCVYSCFKCFKKSANKHRIATKYILNKKRKVIIRIEIFFLFTQKKKLKKKKEI